MRSVHLLWRQAALIWRAKGYTHTTAADALEARFGEGNGFGRSRITLLVTTRCEPCPPEVAEFILDDDEDTGMKVRDPDRWARFQRELTAILEERPGEAPLDLREVAREAATLVMDTVRAWLDTAGSSLEALVQSRLDGHGAKLDAHGAQLDSTESKLDSQSKKLDGQSKKLETLDKTTSHTEALAELLTARTDTSEQQRRKDKLHQMAVTIGMGTVIITAVAIMTCTSRSTPEAPVQKVTVNVGQGAAEAVERTLPASASGVPDLRNFFGAVATAEMGKKVPPEQYVPDGPLPGQKLPPCDAGLWEKEVNGGCWGKMEGTPPCDKLFRYKDGCYRPIAADPAKPVGVVPNTPRQEQHQAQQ